MAIRNFIAGAAAMAAVALASGAMNQASAAPITFSGNECGAGGFSACTYDGSFAIIKFRPNGTVEDQNTTLFPTVDGNEFSFTGLDGSSGTWSYTPGVGDPLITAVAAKGGNGYNVFEISPDGQSGGLWFTPLNNGGQAPALSHITFFDTVGPTTPPVAVPEPAAMMILGTALLGLFMVGRRRRT